MITEHALQADWTSPPGDTIGDILQERKLSTIEFAQRLGWPLGEFDDLLHGRLRITLSVARELSAHLGASVQFWVARDFQYLEDLKRLRATETEWLGELPRKEMADFGWASPPPRASDDAAPYLSFFSVPSVRAWQEAYADVQALVAFRTSPTFGSRPAAVAAWLRQGEIEAQAIDCRPWDPERFRATLQQIRSLTRDKDPQRFLPELQRLCAECGVAVVIVRAPSGCRASGATRFASSDKAILQLSFRYLTDDHFWFSFFHEASHLLLHSKSQMFLEGADTSDSPEAQEREANELAATLLVPIEFVQPMLSLPLDSHEVIRFARRVGVSPGIIVGQLQHHRRIGRSQLNRLKRRFQWEA